ncbi:MAG TPA: VWA domain-containing protein [Anaerolineales bacterium]|nr:VWA domain-containing protein [Anaerolineales bacterium]
MRNIARNLLILTLLFGLAFAPVLPARAQQPDQPQIKITQVDNSQFPKVTVYLSVTNAAGEPVGVDPATIQLSENGQVMQPTNVAGGGQGGAGPLSAMLVMDVSGSMDKNGKIDGAKAAAKAFVDQLRPGDQAGVMAYNTKVNYVQQLTQDHAALAQAIDGIKTGGDTAMYDALIAAEQALKDVSGRKAIIAVTDGLDNRSTHKAPDVISGVNGNSLSISTIGLGDASSRAQTGLDESALKELAQKAGGSYSFEGDAAALAALFKLYARSLQSEYAVTYISPSKLRDGVNRSLDVSLSGAAAAKANYNPGGLLPEVSSQSWLLFAGILGLLLVLLVVPILIRQFGSAGGGTGGSGSKQKSRIKLTDGNGNTAPRPSTPPAQGRVKMK